MAERTSRVRLSPGWHPRMRVSSRAQGVGGLSGPPQRQLDEPTNRLCSRSSFGLVTSRHRSYVAHVPPEVPKTYHKSCHMRPLAPLSRGSRVILWCAARAPLRRLDAQRVGEEGSSSGERFRTHAHRSRVLRPCAPTYSGAAARQRGDAL